MCIKYQYKVKKITSTPIICSSAKREVLTSRMDSEFKFLSNLRLSS